MYPLIKSLSARPAQTAIAAALLLAVALIATACHQAQARRTAEDRLAQSQSELHSTQAELAAAEQRAAAYFETNQELVRRLAAARYEAETSREALAQAKSKHPQWVNQALPEDIRKAVK